MIRVFVAIPLPKEVKDHLYGIQTSLRKEDAKIKWVSKKNLHITLKFIGALEENKLDETPPQVESTPDELTPVEDNQVVNLKTSPKPTSKSKAQSKPKEPQSKLKRAS